MAINPNFLKPNRTHVATAISKILTRPQPLQIGADFWSWGTQLEGGIQYVVIWRQSIASWY